MISYFIKSASCLALLLFFYHFILEKEKMHSFNRFYLLIGVVISLLIPFATITTNSIPETLTAVTTLTEPKFSPENMATIEVEEVIDYTKYFAGFYLLISSLLLIRFGRNLFKIIQKIRLNEKINHANATLVLVDDKILPHTFWKAIFINKNEYENGNIEEELFTHELTHVTQKHTIDVLLIEFLQILFWINPLFIFLKKAVQLNHEFLADEKVIHHHKNTFQYQHLLLNKAAWNNEYYLASNLNYSLTKKRLKMMTTQSSQSKIWIKKLAVIPLLAGFVFLFAERIEAQEKQEIIEVVEELPRKGIITENEVYKNYINRNAYVTYKNKEGKKVSKLYTELTNEEKKRLVLPPPPTLKLKKVTPTKAQFEALKDNSKFAVWLDGKVVKNETLNNYKHTDFARYSNSFVYKNARSKRFPQENQAHLETTKYYEANNKKRVADFESFKKNYNKEITEIVEQKSYKNDYEIRKMIDDVSEFYDLENYNKLNKLYESKRTEIPHYVNSSKERQNILNTNFSILGTVYFNLTKSEKKKTKRPIPPHDPYLKLKKNNLVFYKLRNELTEEDKLLIPPPPPVPNASKEEILKAKKAYQDWKKRTGNDIPPPPPPRKKNN
ncbi:M56 family metallopeptidase [Polaribacter sp. OB-PA-B3]